MQIHINKANSSSIRMVNVKMVMALKLASNLHCSQTQHSIQRQQIKLSRHKAQQGKQWEVWRSIRHQQQSLVREAYKGLLFGV